MGERADAALFDRLTAGRELGLLGPMPIAEQIDHAIGMAAAIATPPATIADLGSGGGVPALVLALTWPGSHWALIESNKRRAAFLDESVAALGLEARVTVIWTRAEAAGRDPSLRHRFELVMARSFGLPAITAECGAPLLQVGGRLLVSEPPNGGGADRWPEVGLAALGLRVELRRSTPVHVVVLSAERPCAERYPRRVGIPAKRPLFGPNPDVSRETRPPP